jgi:hypothetical protein
MGQIRPYMRLGLGLGRDEAQFTRGYDETHLTQGRDKPKGYL